MKLNKKQIIYIGIIVLYIIFILISIIIDFNAGIQIGLNFKSYLIEMLKILPLAFILIGLFEVWIKRETVEKHLGKKANFLCFFWAIILGSTTIGPMLVALPIAHSLYKKGAKLSVIFTYVGASAVCRIPMTIFEASFVGVKFTLIRYMVSIPLIIITSIIFEKVLENKKFVIKNPE